MVVMAVWPAQRQLLADGVDGAALGNATRCARERKGEQWAGGRHSDSGAEEARGEAELHAAILRVMADLPGYPVARDTSSPQLHMARGKQLRW